MALGADRWRKTLTPSPKDCPGSPRLVQIVAGKDAPQAAAGIWALMTGRERGQCLWDVPYNQRLDCLVQCVAASPLIVLGLSGSRPFVLGWIAPNGRQARTCAIHFVCASPPPEALIITGKQYLKALAKDYACLISLIPEPFRGARRLAKALGFSAKARLPHACHIETHQRTVNGCFMVKYLEALCQ